jgi:hypothetical protein
MQFEFEIYPKDGYITIVPYSESEVELDPENFDITIDSFWNYIVKEELNKFTLDYYDPTVPDGHHQESGTLSQDDYFLNSYDTIKQDLKHFLIHKNLI